MNKPNDDLEAVRIIADALKEFEKTDQERIIRWARERVGLESPTPSVVIPQQTPSVVTTSIPVAGRASSIKEFIDSKAPKKDIHFAATVAFYYRFEAPEGSRKEAINSDDLLGACRLTGRNRFKTPVTVLNNAERLGLLDRHERGSFKINAVGENLVAMGLPGNVSNVVKKKSVRGAKNNQRKR